MRWILAACFAIWASGLAAQGAGAPLDAGLVEACHQSYNDRAEEVGCIGDAANLCQGVQTEAFNGGTTLGITACLAAETEAWDVILNRNYKVIMREMKAMDAASGGAGLSRAEALRAAQRAWIAFRDAECRRLFAEYQDGSIRSVVAAGCMLDLTAKRALELGGRGR